MSAEASATTLAVAAAAASSSAKNSRCSSRGISSQQICRQGKSTWVSKEDTVNLQALRVFASYLPAGLVLRYAASADPRPPVQPEREDFEAVVCFLDVSGFTALSEKLQKDHGQAGAELLNKYINAYFERLIERLSAHGDDVIKLAGDALQCIRRNAPRWPGQQEQSLPSLVLRASACCIDIVAQLNNYSPVPGVVLQLHIGVGAGTISSFCVGGYEGKWEYFISGEPIEQVSVAAEAAGSGELVLSRSSLARLREALSTLEVELGPHAALREEGGPVAAPEAGPEAGPEAEPKMGAEAGPEVG